MWVFAWASAVLIPTRAAGDLYAVWWQHISMVGATSGVGGTVQARSGGGARRPELTNACQGFWGTLGAKVAICKPRTPKPRDWSSVFATTLSGHSCRVGRSPHRPTSTANCRSGWCRAITASTEYWGVARLTGSTGTDHRSAPRCTSAIAPARRTAPHPNAGAARRDQRDHPPVRAGGLIARQRDVPGSRPAGIE